MTVRKIALTLALCLAGVAACYANPNMGTWKLNEAKSKFPPEQPRTPRLCMRPRATR